MKVILGILALILALAVVLRVIADQVDRSRIRAYIAERGGFVQTISWAPFGKGWFGEKSARIYRVQYTDSSGTKRSSTCKTRMLGGVYWTEESTL